MTTRTMQSRPPPPPPPPPLPRYHRCTPHGCVGGGARAGGAWWTEAPCSAEERERRAAPERTLAGRVAGAADRIVAGAGAGAGAGAAAAVAPAAAATTTGAGTAGAAGGSNGGAPAVADRLLPPLRKKTVLPFHGSPTMLASWLIHLKGERRQLKYYNCRRHPFLERARGGVSSFEKVVDRS